MNALKRGQNEKKRTRSLKNQLNTNSGKIPLGLPGAIIGETTDKRRSLKKQLSPLAVKSPSVCRGRQW